MVTGATATPPVLPALAVGTVHHTRHTPLRHAFTYTHYQWLVDVDALPRLPWAMRVLGRFDARDHLDRGRGGGGIRGDLARWLARHAGLVLGTEDRVLMLAHARTLGHVFDPLTLFWVLRPDGALKALVLEVHNTYGERHAYLVGVDAAGEAVLDKEFYVSPFNDTSGRYAVAVRLSPERVRVSIGLERDGERVLSAVTTGALRPATPRAVLAVAGRHLFMTHRVSALIRWHGVRLWLRRLPIQPRPHHVEDAVR
jgi:uncharacterized protein